MGETPQVYAYEEHCPPIEEGELVWLGERLELSLVDRQEFWSGAAALRYQPG